MLPNRPPLAQPRELKTYTPPFALPLAHPREIKTYTPRANSSPILHAHDSL